MRDSNKGRCAAQERAAQEPRPLSSSSRPNCLVNDDPRLTLDFYPCHWLESFGMGCHCSAYGIIIGSHYVVCRRCGMLQRRVPHHEDPFIHSSLEWNTSNLEGSRMRSGVSKDGSF